MRKTTRFLEGSNGAGEEIPLYSCVRVTAFDPNTGMFSLAKPDTDGQFVFLTDKTSIASGSNGVFSDSFPMLANYDSADGTPAIGEAWGAGAGTFKLKKGKAGFVIAGDPNTADETVPVRRVDASTDSVADVTYSQRGVVNLSDQFLGAGTKKFEKLLLSATPGSDDASKDITLENDGNGNLLLRKTSGTGPFIDLIMDNGPASNDGSDITWRKQGGAVEASLNAESNASGNKFRWSMPGAHWEFFNYQPPTSYGATQDAYLRAFRFVADTRFATIHASNGYREADSDDVFVGGLNFSGGILINSNGGNMSIDGGTW